MQPARPSTRDLRIDFFRGLALIFIFWDHIPGTLFGEITMRNFGFSDAAELFVFLSGVSVAIAYSKRLQRKGYVSAVMHLLQRTWTLYIAHVFVLTQLMAMLFIVNDHVLTRDYVNEMGLRYFLDNPKQALIASSLLKFRPGLMDPLPLYIVLLGMFALMLPLVVRRPLIVFLLSAELYLLAIFCDWNLEARPNKMWFFNPFTWQFLFFIGAILGAHREACSQWLASRSSAWRRSVLQLTLFFLALSVFVVLSWRWPSFHDLWMPTTVAQWLYPISKTDLAGTRLLHFLVLVLAVVLLVPQGAWLEKKLPRALRAMGQHSLPVFCCSVILSPAADAINAWAGDRIVMQCITALGGAILLWCVAQLLEWYDRDAKQSQKS
ncbi:MAG: OpgC domain-containing protein [Pseudomonadales bacterium]